MNGFYLRAVCDDKINCGERMAGTLQRYLMPCFYFSHVSPAERDLKKITAQIIDSFMVLISPSCAS